MLGTKYQTTKQPWKDVFDSHFDNIYTPHNEGVSIEPENVTQFISAASCPTGSWSTATDVCVCVCFFLSFFASPPQNFKMLVIIYFQMMYSGKFIIMKHLVLFISIP